ncbi:MAG: hypothetical protein HGGPFJEG_02446 [Ignavibacteria bacterium]|nr:hypothetical protein [Ignavibacteria bacterium]
MKQKKLSYLLSAALICIVAYSFKTMSANNTDPRNDGAPSPLNQYDAQLNADGTGDYGFLPQQQTDTTPPLGFPYPTVFNWNYSAIPGVNGGTVGAIRFNNRFYMNRWNSAVSYRFASDGPGGGPGTLLDSNTAYNAGIGAIRDLTSAPDGSGTMYLWGGSASTTLYKMDSLLNLVASYVHTGAAYRAIAWDPNRKGFWSCNFAGNIVCRDTNGVILGTIVNSLTSKYGLGFDSASVPGKAYLWVWEQSGVTGGTINKLHKFDLETGLLANTYTFTLTGGDIGIAGGAEVEVADTNVYLYLNWQNYAVTGYDLKHTVGVLTNDVGTSSINSPPTTISFQSTHTPQATISNFGSATQTFNVTMTIEPGGYSSTQVVNNLGPLSITNVNFASFTGNTAGTYTIKCYTQLGTDQDLSNDTLTRGLTVNPPTNSQVVPNAYEFIPGTGSFLGPLTNTARTYQFLIQASQLTDVAGKYLSGIKMRIPTSATANWPLVDVTYTNYDIYLSGSVEPSARSLTFANNIVGPQTQVRSGSLFIPANSYTFGSSPNAFGPSITFNTPWYYAGGNLLIELRHTGFSGSGRSTDALTTTTGGYGTLMSACYTSSYTGTTGSQGNFTVVEVEALPNRELELTALIEGFYDGALKTDFMISDTAKVYVRNSSPPYALVDSSTAVLDNNGQGTFSFSNAVNGVSYYIVFDHRNSITTWSASGNTFTGDSLDYDFTTAASQAYGNNQILKGANYAIYSGDANKDGVIDGGDGSLVDNDASNFVSGYVVTDVNGDQIIDGSDAAIVDNNASNFIGVISP